MVYEMTIGQVYTFVTIVFELFWGQLFHIGADMGLDRFLGLDY